MPDVELEAPELDDVDEEARRTGFSGVVRVDRSGETELAAAYGFADRRHQIPNTLETRTGGPNVRPPDPVLLPRSVGHVCCRARYAHM
mgnify:CR=1 FL=1